MNNRFKSIILSKEKRRNKYDEMEKQLTSLPEQESISDNFIEAAYNGNMKKLLEYATNVMIDCKNSKGETPLIAATIGGQTKAVFFLLAKGADVTLFDATGNTALHQAVRTNHLDVLEKLVFKCNPNFKNKEGQTIVHIAVEECNLKILENIMTIPNINLNEEDSNGDTACHIAVRHKNLKILSKILEKSIDLSVYNHEGKNPLNLAVEENEIEFLKMMIETKSGGITITNKTLYGESNLEIAIRLQNSSIVSFLLQPKCQPEHMISCEIDKKFGVTSLHWAVVQMDLDLIEKLLNINTNLLNVKNRFGKIPLDLICSMNEHESSIKEKIVDIAITLIAEGSDMNLIQNKNGLYKLIKDTFQIKFKS